MDKLNSVQTQLGCGRTLFFNVEDKPYKTDMQYMTGLEIKKIAGLEENSELYLTIKEPWKDEPIENAEKIDLARPGIEGFYIRKKLGFVINGKKFKSEKQYLTGEEIREIGNIDGGDDIFLSIVGPYEDELILDNTRVNLARPGIEHFFSKEVDREIMIIVNGKPKTWGKRKISFDEVVSLAEGNANSEQKAYTVTYLKGPKQNPEGEMAKGDIVFVTDKMIFNATPTDKS